jgi:hypothetical protein
MTVSNPPVATTKVETIRKPQDSNRDGGEGPFADGEARRLQRIGEPTTRHVAIAVHDRVDHILRLILFFLRHDREQRFPSRLGNRTLPGSSQDTEDNQHG